MLDGIDALIRCSSLCERLPANLLAPSASPPAPHSSVLVIFEYSQTSLFSDLLLISSIYIIIAENESCQGACGTFRPGPRVVVAARSGLCEQDPHRIDATWTDKSWVVRSPGVAMFRSGSRAARGSKTSDVRCRTGPATRRRVSCAVLVIGDDVIDFASDPSCFGGLVSMCAASVIRHFQSTQPRPRAQVASSSPRATGRRTR
jgi:hypothetical protein